MQFNRRVLTQIKIIFFSLIFSALRVLKSKKISFIPFGINYIGYYTGTFGLGVALRTCVRASHTENIPLILRNIRPDIKNLQTDFSLRSLASSNCNYPINCFNINPDLFYKVPLWLKHSEWREKYNIGYWFWELANAPATWKYAAEFVDEVWVSSDFNLFAMRNLHSRVIKIPMGIHVEQSGTIFDLKKYGVNDSSFKFLTSFDFFSSFNRKNPISTIKAFLMAFPKCHTNVNLIVKSINGNQFPNELMLLKTAAQDDKRIIVIDSNLTSEEQTALMTLCNSYISLHRAEGFGLGLAEAMFLSKPVIATGYSGNLEFMNPENSFLVPYELKRIQKDEYSNAQGQYWADPNIFEASKVMKLVYENESLRTSIGLAAKCYIQKYHSINTMGNCIKNRLLEIKNNSSK